MTERHRQKLMLTSGADAARLAAVVMLIFCFATASARLFEADPKTYEAMVRELRPGDTLRLVPGTYRQGLRLHELHGRTEAPIVIEGTVGSETVLVGVPGRNTISFKDASHITLRNFSLRSALPRGDAIKAEGFPGCDAVHHVTLEGLSIRGYGAHQQQVAISTKCNAWGWIVRGNTIEGAGTGMYFGDSDGNAPFVHGLIEHNVVRDTRGYNLQIKHQLVRPSDVPGMPRGAGATTIRYNLFSKARGASIDGRARPNVLVGHGALSGPGVEDAFHIYGNLFHENPVEALFQGEGNLAIYNNLFLRSQDSGFPAIAIQPHNFFPRRVQIFHNTVLARGVGIRVSGGPSSHEQAVVANAVFADVPIQARRHSQNVTAPYDRAGDFVNKPFGALGQRNLQPLPGALRRSTGLPESLSALADSDRDYSGCQSREPYAGAYVETGSKPKPHRGSSATSAASEVIERRCSRPSSPYPLPLGEGARAGGANG